MGLNNGSDTIEIGRTTGSVLLIQNNTNYYIGGTGSSQQNPTSEVQVSQSSLVPNVFRSKTACAKYNQLVA